MDLLVCEVRYAEDETRESPGRLTGTLLTYETRANDRPELFSRGALTWPANGINIDEMHDRSRPVVRALPELRGDALVIDVALPNTQRGRDAATNVREGVYTGLSVEFRATREGRRGALREIRSGMLVRAGLVDTPAYLDSTVEVRSEGGANPAEGGNAMAVTIDAAALAAAMRLGDAAEETAEATRLLAYATAAVVRHAPDAPDVIHNEAAIRLGAYVYDSPFAAASGRYSNPMRYSGAASILLPYREHRLGLPDADTSDLGRGFGPGFGPGFG